jgi:hypothetical protein
MSAADLNGDGFVDIVVGNQDNIVGVSGRDRRYLNNGTSDPFANVAPVIDSAAGTFTMDQDTDLTLVLGDVEVTDPDNVFPADFTLTVQDGDNYSVADNTVTPDVGFAGELTVPVVVNDGTDDSNTFNLTITVTAILDPNNAPAFDSTPVTAATEGTAYLYEAEASDADGDTLTMTAPTLPAWLTFSDNGDGTATLTGTPAAGDVGDHDVSLVVSDGTDTTVQEFTITVEADDTVVPPPPAPPPSGSGGGGGSLGFLSVLALMAFGATTKRRRRLI